MWRRIFDFGARARIERIFADAWLWRHCQAYNRAIAEVVGREIPSPNHVLHGSWALGTPFGDLLNAKLFEVITAFEESLIAEVHETNVEGDIVEFGVYQGYMLRRLIEKAESIGLKRRFFGFDSFEGLSQPSSENDTVGWQKGQFASTYEATAEYLSLATRPNVKLIKGWVEESLKSPEAQEVNPIAYARIDVDIHAPAVDCLNYLSNRLADRAILVFDDWPYMLEKGETKAFFDWVPTVPHYRFEFIAQCNWRFYLRVHHR